MQDGRHEHSAGGRRVSLPNLGIVDQMLTNDQAQPNYFGSCYHLAASVMQA